jgi:hypothetical protein
MWFPAELDCANYTSFDDNLRSGNGSNVLQKIEEIPLNLSGKFSMP